MCVSVSVCFVIRSLERSRYSFPFTKSRASCAVYEARREHDDSTSLEPKGRGTRYSPLGARFGAHGARLMPLINRIPFVRIEPPCDLRADEEVFVCRTTKELFRDYK